MNRLNEHDITKKMLKTLRTPLLNEEVDRNKEIELEPSELRDEQDSFIKAVTTDVDFISFKIYPNSNNVVFSGKFNGLGKLEWLFTLEEYNGLYISCDNTQLTEESLITIKKLKGYYDTWRENWSEKIRKEYKAERQNDED